jgi:hypothetical protein
MTFMIVLVTPAHTKNIAKNRKKIAGAVFWQTHIF